MLFKVGCSSKWQQVSSESCTFFPKQFTAGGFDAVLVCFSVTHLCGLCPPRRACLAASPCLWSCPPAGFGCCVRLAGLVFLCLRPCLPAGLGHCAALLGLVRPLPKKNDLVSSLLSATRGETEKALQMSLPTFSNCLEFTVSGVISYFCLSEQCTFLKPHLHRLDCTVHITTKRRSRTIWSSFHNRSPA